MAMELYTLYDVAHLEELQRVFGKVVNPEVVNKNIKVNTITGVLAFASAGVVFALGGRFVVLALIGVGFLFLSRGIFFYKMMARGLRAKMDKKYKGNNYTMKDDCICVSNIQGTFDFKYEECDRLLETPKCIYVMMSDGQGLILDKSTLEGGSEDQLRTMLEKKTGRTLEFIDLYAK